MAGTPLELLLSIFKGGVDGRNTFRTFTFNF